MAVIALEGMHFFAYHGYYEEEQKMGGDFIIDVYVTTNTALAAQKDDLEGTINYETIYFICKTEMKKTSKMIENVAQRIIDRLHFILGDRTQNIKVRLTKLNPPLGGKVKSASIELEKSGQSSKSTRSEEFDRDEDEPSIRDFRSLFG